MTTLMSGVSTAFSLALSLFLCLVGPVEAGDAMATALQQLKAQVMRPLPTVPPPAQPREEWVPERQVWVPGLGVFARVPVHWERRLTETQSAVPPLTISPERDHAPLVIPAGERPPADIRTGP